jgi:alkanesulfonate monooxygenase SsuD/methylene tetrahydromethanopterin reductase-like flavin-dependent oxidoreductase (luciferase family)
MDLGLITFGSLLPDARTGTKVSQRERLRDVVRAAREAEDFGFAWYTVGEHHFRDRDVIPNPTLVLAAIAQHTSTIRLATGTTLLANRDPVLLAEDYAMLDLLSDGRLELIAGGSFFPEPYVVFDQAPESKAARKRENLDLLIRLWTEDRVSWQGAFRPPLDDVLVQPRILQPQPPLWISGGANRDSVELAVEYGLPMVFGTTAREPNSFVEPFNAYRALWQTRRSDPPGRLGAASHVFVAETSQRARSLWFSYIDSYLSARKTGPLDFDSYIGDGGPALCGSPAEIVDKLGRLQQLWGHDLHLLAVDIGGIPYATVQAATELIASDVLPHVRAVGFPNKVAASA